MCGITGWIDWKRDLSTEGEILGKMVESLTPRGPDASGMWLDTKAALGHRRLIVVDPEGGTQPMLRQQGESTYVLCYNGELYNTQEIRSDLISRGYSFRGHSDTEVLLTAYMEWGEQCLERLNGIFAFAVWDQKHQTLFLARDRMGVKPLFYTVRGTSFLFASELKALLQHPFVEPEIDLGGLAEIFCIGPARTPGNGIFHGIQELRPGYSLKVQENGLKLKQYWRLYSKSHEDDIPTTIKTVRELFSDAVQRQLVSDVPVCTLLSGGLDSSAITAYAAQHYREHNLGPLHTFSIDYEGNDRFFRPNAFQPNADDAYIREMVQHSGTIHHWVSIGTGQLVDSLTDAVMARDVPGMADVDSSLLLFCRQIKQQATVALSGECADEIFGGYPWFRNPEARDAGTFPWSLKLKERTSILSPELLSLIKPEEYVAERYRETLDEVPVLPGESPLEARMREMFYLNLKWFMVNLLERKDRMSMATGLEVRVPFCDHRLVEYVWNVPWSIKYYGKQEKGLLRQALTGVLPEKVLHRRKSPYPKTHNPAYLSAVRNWLREIVAEGTSPLLPLLNLGRISELMSFEGDEFDFPWFGQLMTGPQLFAYLIQVDAWLRHYNVRINP